MEFDTARRYTGHLDQLFALRSYTMHGGRGEGVRAIELHNGDLDITVLPDRCMDFYQVRYRGKSLNYIAPCGIVGPSHCQEDGMAFLDGFFCGLLTTCGLSNIGSPCMDEDTTYGLHGRISAAPAEAVDAHVEMRGGVPTAVMRGTVREAALFGANLSLQRTIICRYGENRITFTDEVVNEGFRTVPLMLLYHFNMGYPLLSEQAKLHIPSQRVIPRTPWAQAHLGSWAEITAPATPYEEMCYYHDLQKDETGLVTVGIANPAENMALHLTYDSAVLDHFVQWKQLGCGEYAMGLEPCNATIEGRDKARADGTIKYIEPGQRISYPFTIAISGAES